MRLSGVVLQAGLLLCTASTTIAASWTFSDATVSVQGKGSGVGAGFKEK
jgi:oligosaccharyltransferase complex subunit delta (ribophorin II)